MPAPASGSAEAASSASTGPAGVSAAVLPTASGTDAFPVVGRCWREKYDIVAETVTTPELRVWRGRRVDGGQEVVLRGFRPAEPEIRAQAWAKLGGIDSPHLQHARDGHRLGEWRVEVADAPIGTPLDEWRAARASVDADTVKAIVAQLAEALAALHAFELVHLALRPENVFVQENGAALNCLMGGLDALTSFDRKEAVPAAVDVLYAPPEAYGLTQHVPGPGLCAWDWWSLGRVAQELVLGRHVVAVLANGSTRPPTPEVRTAAENLLLEVDQKGPRAGAVEKMGELDPQLRLLLRGLLTSTKDARWTGDNVDRWVRGLPVKEHYDTPRVDTHFRWRGRPYTVPEVAALLQTAEHWAENSVQLFEPTTPGTLAHFLRWTQTQGPAHEQLTSALELRDALPLKMSSPAAQREAVTMVALLQLSAGKLIWRGRPFDAAAVNAMMAELGEADAVLVLRALTTRSTALQIERIDAAGGRLLTELGRTAGDVEGLLKRHGWLAATDAEGAARLFRLALEPAPALRSARDALAKSFAGSDHPAMEKIFKAQNLGRGELVALAWAAPTPDKFKFYTHEEANRRRAVALRARGAELIATLTWPQFEKATALGRVALYGWGWFIGTWFAAGLAAMLLWPGPLGAALALAPAVVALLFRMLVAPREARALRKFIPEAKWGWRDGPGRCRREFRLAGHGVAVATLETELANVRKELESLKDVKPAPEPLPGLPRFRSVRMAGLASWVLLAAGVGGGVWQFQRHPPTVKAIVAAWAPAKPKPGQKPEVEAKRKPETEADFKMPWPYKADDQALKVTQRANRQASSAQIEFATKHGRELVAPYRPETIATLIFMPVATEDESPAVMMFDGKRGELVNQQLYLLEFRPIARTWVEIGGRQGIFLDQ